jgi:diguanylate cyclase (GGDEF)-like protein/PAS domain S-box-containing protein
MRYSRAKISREVRYLKSKIKNLEKGFFVKYIIATLCLIAILTISIAHSKYMDQKIADISKVYLSKISLQNADIISNQIRTNLQTLNVIARVIGNGDDFTMEKIDGILKAEARDSDFISMGVVLKDGGVTFTPIAGDNSDKTGESAYYGMEQDGRKLLLNSDWEYISKTIAGNVGLSGSPSRIVNGETVNIYALPIYRGGIAGALVAFLNEESFNNLILPETLDENGCSYIADWNGNIIFHSESWGRNEQFTRIIQKLSTNWSMEGENGEKLRRDIKSGLSDTIEYDQGRERIYISYVPIDFHGWYLVSITNTTAAKAQSKSIYDNIIPAFIYILVIIMTVAFYFVYIRTQTLKRLERKMQIEAINDESYRMIMEQTDDIIFEYDTRDKTYFHTANFCKNFGYEPTKTGFLGSLEYDYVHPDDVIRFAELYERMKQDRKLAEAEVRIINSEGEYLWTRIYMLGVFDREDKLARVIGKIVNIDEKKKELQYLKEKAVTDSATGVYNKQTTEEMIKAFLNGEGKYGKHALLMIDIDNFKGINDDHGHRVGDAVISAMGIELNHIFRTSDIKGRIGGDEFMILMKDIEDMDLIINKAATICQMFGNYELGESRRIKFSASIGIAIYAKDGSTYEQLYEAADLALYNCKNYQKGTYAFCKDSDSRTSSR